MDLPASDYITRYNGPQRLTARQRAVLRQSLGVPAIGTVLSAGVYGLGVFDGSSYIDPDTMLPDPDVPVTILPTLNGHWSSSGTETAPVSGQWLMVRRTATTRTVNSETIEDAVGGTESRTTVQWSIEYWDDGIQDDIGWTSETLLLADVTSLFDFIEWTPTPGAPGDVWILAFGPDLGELPATILAAAGGGASVNIDGGTAAEAYGGTGVIDGGTAASVYGGTSNIDGGNSEVERVSV